LCRSEWRNEEKAEATAARLRRINPNIEIEVFGREWPQALDELLQRYPVVINGMDDIAAGINLYRRARKYGATVIDAYTSSLPSVTVVRPNDPRPEERLSYPSLRRDVNTLDDGHYPT
jgi:molybdopterin/thiamine biosynthesis adenylyltransferase